MYDDDSDIERDFWRDEPTRRLGRVPLRPAVPTTAQRRTLPGATGRVERTRQHIPVITTPERRPRRPLDPFLKRLGLIVCVGVAVMPLAYSLRQGAGSVLQTAPTGGAAAVPVLSGSTTPPADASVAVPGQSSAAAGNPIIAQAPPVVALEMAETPTPTTDFDIDALPPATPVNAVETTPVATQAPVTTPTTVAAKASSGTATAAVTSPATAAPNTEAPHAEAPTTAATCSKTYAVVSGDYWILIAQKVDVAIKDLLSVNGATTATALFPGRQICLPKNASTPSSAAAPVSPVNVPATTVKPTAATIAPTTTLPHRTYSAAEVEAIIREVWPDDLEDEAVRIARRESNLQPTARNSCCYGLFQIYWSVHRGWLAQAGVTSAEQLFDPTIAARAGLALYQRSGGWGPWAI